MSRPRASLLRPSASYLRRASVALLTLVALGSGAALGRTRLATKHAAVAATPVVQQENKTDVLDACTPGNIFVDGSFEASDPDTLENPNYTVMSTVIDTPVCTVNVCDNDNGAVGPRTGDFWSWFGGFNGSSPDTTSIAQTVTFPTNATSVTLNYYLWIGRVASPYSDTFTVRVDGTTLQTWQEPSVAEAGYTQRTLDLTAFADGASHIIQFRYTQAVGGGAADFSLDDISLDVLCSGSTSSGTDSVGVYVPSTGTFFLRNSNTSGVADISASYGAPNATPLHGDWNGDGTDTIGIYDSATGAFFLKNNNTPGNADIVLQFGPGGSNFVPLSGDWNGDGVDTIGIYDTSNGNFFLRNSNTGGVADIVVTFGAGGPGVYPVVGDWDNNGTDTVGIYNQNTGTFFLKLTNTPGNADLTFTFGAAAAGLLPVTGDWNNDGTDSVGVYNPATGTFFLKNTNTSGNADLAFSYGPAGLVPLAGDWNGM